MVSQQQLVDFVRGLPEGLPFTPILGGKRPDHSYEPHPGKAHMGILDLEAAVRRGSTDFTAIGLWCNPVGRLVILDCDKNLATLRAEHGDDLAKAPCITSPKKNAAKFLFRLAKEVDETKLHGVSLAATGRGFEILWGPGRQGVVFGAYPANDHAPDGGEYTLTGDLGNIPPAPDWMLNLMLRAREQEVASGGVLTKQLKYGGIKRPLEHTRKVIAGCLSVLTPNCDYGTWIAIGMAIHASMPGDEGRRFWSEWSKQSTLHADAWEKGDPCAEKWDTFRRGKTSIATLIWLADQIDGDRERFDDETRQKMAEDEAADKDTFADLMMKLEAVYTITNPAEADYEMQKIREQFPRAERSFLDGLYIAHMQHTSRPSQVTGGEFLEQEFSMDYIIPDMLYAPSLVLLYGEPGAGKTQAGLAIVKTIMRSTDVSIRGRKMPIAGGPILIAQNDQNDLILQEMLIQHGFTREDQFVIQNGFNIRDRAGIVSMMKQHKPRAVLIDSLSACAVGSPHSENAKEFGDPLYFLAKANGSMFPPCLIIVIHHSNKQGGHRGTSAITAAVDEVIKLRLPDDEEIAHHGPDMRVLNFEKSRSGRGGTHVNMFMENDLSFRIADPARPAETPRTSLLDTIQGRILSVLREAYPHELTIWEICQYTHTADGSIRPNLARMVKRNLVARGPDQETTDRTGRPQKLQTFKAVLASHIETTDVPPLPLEPTEESEES